MTENHNNNNNNNNENIIKLGILGCANIAKKISLALNYTSNIKLYAIASRNSLKVKQFQNENNLNNNIILYDNYNDLINDNNINAIYIPLPTILHLEWVIKCAENKKHIIIEKPVAINSIEFQKMIQICKDNNVFLMDGTMFMHHPRTTLLKNALRDISCGHLHRVQTCLTFPADPNFFATNIRTKVDADPLGAIGDLGWYCTRIGILAFSWKASNDDNFIRYPVSAQAFGTRWTDDGVPLEFNAYVFFSEDKREILSFDCSFFLPFRQKFELVCSTPSPEYGDQLITGDDFVLPISPTEASFIIDVAPLPGKLQNVNPDPHEFHTVIGDTSTGTQQQKMLEFFANTILNQTYETPDGDYWGKIALVTQSTLDAIFESMKNNGVETPVQRYD